jgi:hypothetical protein
MPNLANETGVFVVSDNVLGCVVVVLLWSVTFIYITDVICTHLKA